MAKDLSSRWYIGSNPRVLAHQSRSQRFFYGLRSADGELILGKVDAFDATDGVQVNGIGDRAEDDFPYFVPGQDFFEGKDEEHADRYPSLLYQQYKFADADFNYYIDENGELTLRVFQGIGEGEVDIPFVPLNPKQVDYRRFGVFPTFDNITVTFDNTSIKFDNKDPNS
tara:strand:- start:1684 stop:2190 length:507 start_codon:yes stop_codon:yes gene_type:complete